MAMLVSVVGFAGYAFVPEPWHAFALGVLMGLGNGIFWPKPGDEGADWIDATDHHMVWYDLTK